MDGTRRAIAAAVAATTLYAASARAEGPAPPLIWYRSTEACPDSAGFLERLAARGIQARLAAVGEPIDFVVTLGVGADGAHGLLERQTKTGTVAIRRLDGGNCDEIADGLALSLSLADAPEERRHEEHAPTVPESTETKKIPVLPAEQNQEPIAMPTAPAELESRARVSLGAQTNVVTGVAPDPVLGGALFVDLALGGSGPLSRSSVRAGAFGATGASTTDAYDYRVSFVGGRIAACPTWLGGTGLRVHPCASVDLGTIQTAGTGATGRASGAFWSAARLGLRFDVPLGDSVALEAQADAQVPLTRYEIVAGTAENTLYRTAAAGFAGGLGAYFTLP